MLKQKFISILLVGALLISHAPISANPEEQKTEENKTNDPKVSRFKKLVNNKRFKVGVVVTALVGLLIVPNIKSIENDLNNSHAVILGALRDAANQLDELNIDQADHIDTRTACDIKLRMKYLFNFHRFAALELRFPGKSTKEKIELQTSLRHAKARYEYYAEILKLYFSARAGFPGKGYRLGEE